MINIAFTMIGGKNWRGGYNYLFNLLMALSDFSMGEVTPFLFVGNDLSDSDIAPFLKISSLKVVRSDVFNKSNNNIRLFRSIVLGLDRKANDEFVKAQINIVFESAQFYGWRFPIQTIAWIPDFQHKHLKYLFSKMAYWKREIGFTCQVLFGRHILLSSSNAKSDCEKFYPYSKGRTHVLHFAVPCKSRVPAEKIREIKNIYELPEIFFYLPNQFWKHKNHECVIRALGLLKSKKINIVVVSTGQKLDTRDTLHFPNIEKLVHDLDLQTNFIMLGMIPYEHVDMLLHACVALINPSKFEGWSTTVEEAKSIGKPMILSSIPVHYEQAKHAIFFNPDSPSQLAEVLKNYHPPRTNAMDLKENISESTGAMSMFANDFTALLKEVFEKTV